MVLDQLNRHLTFGQCWAIIACIETADKAIREGTFNTQAYGMNSVELIQEMAAELQYQRHPPNQPGG